MEGRLNTLFCLAVLAAVCCMQRATAAEDDCEVCIGVIKKFSVNLSSDEKSSPPKIEAKFREFCSTAKNRENRFCYYVGGSEDSATGILGEMSKPMSWGMPPEKICEKLKKKDAQICELRYEKQIDLTKVDLKKLKVKDLKKILLDWDENCMDCLEKGDYIRFIEELKPKYLPKTEL